MVALNVRVMLIERTVARILPGYYVDLVRSTFEASLRIDGDSTMTSGPGSQTGSTCGASRHSDRRHGSSHGGRGVSVSMETPPRTDSESLPSPDGPTPLASPLVSAGDSDPLTAVAVSQSIPKSDLKKLDSERTSLAPSGKSPQAGVEPLEFIATKSAIIIALDAGKFHVFDEDGVGVRIGP